MLCQNIQQKPTALTLNTACSLVNLSRHAYHELLKPVSLHTDSLLEPIRAIKNDKDCRKYGYRRVTHALHRQGTKINHKKVLKTMRLNGLIVKRKSFKICTTNSNHGLPVYPNLIRGLKVTKLNQVWVADITYIRFGNNKTAYLASIMDRYSRRNLGWQLSRNIDEQLCLDALHMALQEREGTDLSGLTHHSDQGSQYVSNQYTKELANRDILISMSRKANPYDNAFAESFFKTVKYEEVYMDEYDSFEDAYRNLKYFIEEVYNKKRLHSAIGYVPPAEFEQRYTVKEGVA